MIVPANLADLRRWSRCDERCSRRRQIGERQDAASRAARSSSPAARRDLGGATARMVVEGGGNVVIADLKEAEGQALAKELGAAAKFVRTDVTDEASAQGRGRRGGRRRSARVAWARQLRGHRLRREDRRQGRPACARRLHAHDQHQPDRHVQHDRGSPPTRWRRTRRTPRASAASSSTRRRSPRSTARSGRPPTRVEGGRRRHDAADRARARAQRHPRDDDRAGPLRDADGRPDSGGDRGIAGQDGAVPAAPRAAGGIRVAGRARSCGT